MIAQITLQTSETIAERQKLFALYDYYGIPYGVFDDNSLFSNREKDWSKAIALIAEGKSIPKDLEKRLLEYKALRTDASTRQRTELTNPPVL